MSLESRRIVRRIDAIVQDLEIAKLELREEEGFEPDFTSAAIDLENASEVLAKVIELCNEQG